MWTVEQMQITVQLCLIEDPITGAKTVWLREQGGENPPPPWQVIESREVQVRAISYIESLRAQDAATDIDAATGQAVISASRYMLELLKTATGLDADTIASLPKPVGEKLASMVTRLSDPNLMLPSVPASNSSPATSPSSPSAGS
jgi:hypothetical protein